MNEELTVDQRLRIKAVEVALSILAQHKLQIDFFKVVEDIYEFIKGEQQ
jgi:hypothetical protein